MKDWQKIALFVAGFSLANGERIKARRRQAIEQNKKDGVPQQVPSASNRIVDHPLVAWILDNGFNVAMASWFARMLRGVDEREFTLQTFFRLFFAGIVVEESHMLYRWFLINKVYGHIPFFSQRRKNQTMSEVIKDFFTTNFVVHWMITGFTMAIASYAASKKKPQPGVPSVDIDKLPFDVTKFLAKAVFVKAVVDIGFWIGHYILHLKDVYWLHKKHHEHNYTQLTTNYHFSVPDLIIEAFVPYFFGVALLTEGIGVEVSKFEIGLLFGHIYGFEMDSHAGKPLPMMSTLPPLAPLLRKWDDYNCWSHEVHHNLLKCNYSINPWVDKLFGTSRLA